MSNKVKAYWMQGKNFGDKLTPYFIKKLGGKEADYTTSPYKSRVIGIGSILNWAEDKDVVWGSGLANKTDNVNKKCDIRSVRGPLSRRLAIDCGNKNIPEIYGDPAILLPEIYNPKVDKKYKLGVIPHVSEINLIKLTKNDNILKINLNDPIESVIKQINQCENIISSSLHGIITSDAYRVPCKWVKFSDKILGDGTKFQDHYMSIGIYDMKVTVIKPNKIDLSVIDIIKPYDIIIDTDKLMDACPFK